MVSALIIAGEACVKVELPRYKSMTNDPQRQWAVDYLRAACDGLDYEGFPVPLDDPLTNEVDFKRGPDAADVKARADLSRTDSFGHVVSAADWLNLQKQLPDQVSYDLSIKEMTNAFTAAAKLRTCNSMQACGADSLMTAIICAEFGCPYGTTLQENYERLFGGVIAFNCADFERVNGYSNDYWGWGYEDTDLLQRCQHGGLTIERRDGTFVALPHAHAGYRDDDSPSQEAEAMRALFEAKQAQPERARIDGLGSVRFELVDTRQGFDENGRPLNHIHHHRIRWT